MKLWFSSSSEVPIYRQLATQVALAIVSGDVKPGDRLPSTRELARRFALHPNTISAGYRQLERDGWTERRHGSGGMAAASSSGPMRRRRPRRSRSSTGISRRSFARRTI